MEILKTFLGSVLQYLMLNTAFKPFSIINIIKSLALWFLSILKHLRFCLVKNVKKSRDTQPLKVYAFLNVHNGIFGWFGQLARRCYQKIDTCYRQIYSCYTVHQTDAIYRYIPVTKRLTHAIDRYISVTKRLTHAIDRYIPVTKRLTHAIDRYIPVLQYYQQMYIFL